MRRSDDIMFLVTLAVPICLLPVFIILAILNQIAGIVVAAIILGLLLLGVIYIVASEVRYILRRL